jgi:DNA-binding CsgD family transcriptional regulator
MDLGQLLLELYAAARELSLAEFPPFVFGLLENVLRFDAARCTTLTFLHPVAVVCASHLHHDGADTVFDWEQINRHDTVIPTVEAAPGRAFSFHAPTLFAGRDQSIMRDFIGRTGHYNNLVIALPDDGNGLWRSLSLYRSRPDDRYAERDQRVLELLMPHVVEALRINEALGLHAVPADTSARAALAIAGPDGAILFAGPCFAGLMRREWPQWPGVHLPECVLDRFRATGSRVHAGCFIELSAQRCGALWFVHARAASLRTRLSSRERRVATLYGSGRSHKAIARELRLSPATVRNHLQHIYAKLGVNDKAQLAVLMARDDGFDTGR